jgi:hypothetical protein
MAKNGYPAPLRKTNSSEDKITPPLADSSMKWTIEYQEAGHFVRIVFRGIFNASDHLKMIEDILSQKFWHTGMPILSDDRNLSFEKVNIDVINQASENRQK